MLSVYTNQSSEKRMQFCIERHVTWCNIYDIREYNFNKVFLTLKIPELVKMSLELPNWPENAPKWRNQASKLLMEMHIDDDRASEYFAIEEISENSKKFPVKFPVDTGRIKMVINYEDVTEAFLTRNINSVYPIVHENALKLFADFLILKKQHGSSVEKRLYESMSLKQFIDRLLKKRAVYFYGKFDKFMLLSGEKGSKNWEKIGTDEESPPLLLKNCLSYDEIKLAAFLYVSSYTYFVNKGDRKNIALFSEDRKNIQKEGVIVGMIGPRLKKEMVMDYQEIVISAAQNKEGNGYGQNSTSNIHGLMADFYAEKNLDWDEVSTIKREPARYVNLSPTEIFDNLIYHKRLSIAFDSLLLEANSRAEEAKKNCYLHVVGLGLGVWMISKHQEKLYMQSFYTRIIALLDHLRSISDICFSWFKENNCGGYKDNEKIPFKNHPQGGIRVHFSKREPHEKLVGEHKGKLLVVSYAWDGNALPGNEYWDGKLGSSGDSAAASSTQITELHNPHIHLAICADRLRVVCEKEGKMLTIADYQRKIKEKKSKVDL